MQEIISLEMQCNESGSLLVHSAIEISKCSELRFTESSSSVYIERECSVDIHRMKHSIPRSQVWHREKGRTDNWFIYVEFRTNFGDKEECGCNITLSLLKMV